MGQRGPAPTPTAILKLRGSKLASQREREVSYEHGAPPCPAWLSKEARKEWRRQVRQLTAAGVLQLTDGPLLAVWCQAWDELVTASRQLAQTGLTITYPSGAVGQHPLVAVRNHAVARLLQIAGQFGFSPAARARIRGGGPPSADESLGGKARYFADDKGG